MNKLNIPEELRFLIPEAQKWGIADDGYRDEQIEKSNDRDLRLLTSFFTDDIIIEFNEWLSDEKEVEKSSDEYLLFTCFFMAYEYADSVLKNRHSLS